MASKSGNYNGMNEMTILNIMLSAKDLGVSPHKALNGGFYVVNGKISMSTALMADRIRKEGHSIKIPEWTSQKCTIIGVRKDNNDSIKFEYTMEDATSAGLTNSPTWKKFPKQMLYNRAMATLARTLFPDVVGNAYSEDEKYDIMNVPPEKRPVEDPDCTLEISSPRIPMENRMESLQEILISDGIPIEYLDSYLNDVASKQGKAVELIIDSALMPQLISKFKTSYAKFLTKKAEESEPILD